MMWSIWSTLVIVDQIEDDVVVLEWENQSLSIVDRRWLPTNLDEGDLVTFSLQRVPISNCQLKPVRERASTNKWLTCDAVNPLYLPLAPVWKNETAVYWDFALTTPDS